MNKTSRRTLLKTAGGLTIVGTAGCLGGTGGDSGDGGDGGGGDTPEPMATPDPAPDYPESGRTITGVVPFSPGGGYDWYSRTMAQHLGSYLPNEPEVVVENVTGAGGLVATNQMWSAEPDGYRYMLRHGLSSVAQQIGLPNQVEFNVTEFTNLGQIAVSRYGFIRNPRITDPIENWDDLTAAVTSGRVGTGGVGDAPHLFAIMAGTISGAWGAGDVDFVHYEGFGDSMAGMDRDEIELTIGGISSALPYVADGVTEPVVSFTHQAQAEWNGTPAVVDWDVNNPAEVADSLRAPRIWTAPPGVPDDRADILAKGLVDAAGDSEFVAAAEEAERPLDVLGRDDAERVTESMLNAMQAQSDLLEEVMS